MKLVLVAYLSFTFLLLYQFSIYSISDTNSDVLDANEYNEKHGVNFGVLDNYQNNYPQTKKYNNTLVQYANQFKSNNYSNEIKVVNPRKIPEIPTKNKVKTFSFSDIAKSIKKTTQ